MSSRLSAWAWPALSLALPLLLYCCSGRGGAASGQTCQARGPCDGPPGLLLVGFKDGATQAEIDVANASVNGRVVWPASPPSHSEQLQVDPSRECEASEKLRASPHVEFVQQEPYVQADPLVPAPDATCQRSPYNDPSCRWDDAGLAFSCADGGIHITK